jgi:cytochrome c-type biogenesis protein CcmH/NrfG
MTMAVGVAIILLIVTRPAMAEGPAAPIEPSLEPEFQQLRATLSVRPEFSGPDAVSKYRLAEELAHRGDVAGAVDSYRAAIRLNPDWADPYRGLGRVLLDHHDYADAVEALHTSLRAGGEDQQTFYWLGRAYMGQGDLDAAAGALARASELNPDDAETVADLGLVRMAQGNVAGAEEAVTRSIRMKPDYADAHRLRDRLMSAKRDPELTRQAGLQLLQELFGRE